MWYVFEALGKFIARMVHKPYWQYGFEAKGFSDFLHRRFTQAQVRLSGLIQTKNIGLYLARKLEETSDFQTSDFSPLIQEYFDPESFAIQKLMFMELRTALKKSVKRIVPKLCDKLSGVDIMNDVNGVLFQRVFKEVFEEAFPVELAEMREDDALKKEAMNLFGELFTNASSLPDKDDAKSLYKFCQNFLEDAMGMHRRHMDLRQKDKEERQGLVVRMRKNLKELVLYILLIHFGLCVSLYVYKSMCIV